MADNEDHLTEDTPIEDQEYACLSFISPENEIKNRDVFRFEKFVDQWDLSTSLLKFNQFLGFIAFKYDMKIEDLKCDLEEFCSIEAPKLSSSVGDDFKSFLERSEETLDEEYAKAEGFQTAVRGIKVRGSYATLAEAEARAKRLRDEDESHDVYVGPVGKWMPFHPDAYRTGRVEHLEQELNQLMHKKNQNEAAAKSHFKDRVSNTKKKAIQENMRVAAAEGNKLTQTLDEKGNLVNVRTATNDHEEVGTTLRELRDAVFESSEARKEPPKK